MATERGMATVVRDAPAPEARADGAGGRPARGPLRPTQLTTVRTRQAARLGSHKFRTADLAFLTAITGVVLLVVADRPLPQATVAQVAPFLLGAVLTARLLRSTGLYQFGPRERATGHGLRLAAAVATGGLGTAVLAGLLDGGPGMGEAVWWWAAGTALGLGALHLTWWLVVRRWRRRGWLTPNAVIVGASPQAERLVRVSVEQRNLHVLGIFDDRLARSPINVLGVPVLGNLEALLTHRITPCVDVIVVAIDPSATARVGKISALLGTLPNRVSLLVDQGDEAAEAAAITQLVDAPLAPLRPAADLERSRFAKRVQDLVIGLPALLALAPLLALIALAIKVDSPGPVFFRQRRHGFNNEEIEVWKFRTMRHAAADPRAERQVTAGDPRVTRVGRFLRRTSLDELPQLFNVVRDEMSLVGPRPHAIGMRTGEVESARLVAEYAHRHRIKPGMTGWAAINGSRGPLHLVADVKRRVALDVDYIDRQSFWFDLKIMLLTIPSFVGDRSAIR